MGAPTATPPAPLDLDLPDVVRGPGYTLYRGDCLDVLPMLADETMDAVVTDPPYSSGGALRGDRMADPHKKYRQTGASKMVSFGGDTRDQRGYLAWSDRWMRAAMPVVQRGGLLQCFSDWRQLPVVTDAVQVAGYVWRGIQVWDKGPSARPQNGYYRNQAEYIVSGVKGIRPKNGRFGLGVFRHVPLTNSKRHLTEKPVPVMGELLKPLGEGARVCDPFAGCGTTGVACLRTGRTFVGIEMDPHWFAVAARRLADEAAALAQGGDDGQP